MTGGEPLRVWGSGDRVPDATLAGGIVHKTPGPWTPSIVALLHHLADAGFAGAPRVAGDGFTFVPGTSPHPRAWPDDAVAGVGTLLRGLHDATAAFTPPPGAVWKPSWLRDLGGADMVYGHGDTGPWNIVGRGGRAEAFVDWEFAGPVDRLWELAQTVWLNAQLVDDDVAALHDLPDAAGRARQARAIADAYGLARDRREELLERLTDVAAHSARAEAVQAGVTPDSTDAVTADGYPVLWGVAWRARSASWIARHRGLLRRALTT
jgi:Ser/Thr protein kinase RdoA (MazF antagonist)